MSREELLLALRAAIARCRDLQDEPPLGQFAWLDLDECLRLLEERRAVVVTGAMLREIIAHLESSRN